MVQLADAPFLMQGHVLDMLKCKDKYLLFDGPRGTGKTRPVCEKLVMYARSNQGTRILVLRKTRASMSQTTLVTLEQVLGRLWPPAVSGQCSREHVRSYWVGDSEIVVSGCDQESRTRSGEYAIVWFDEAHEIGLDDWESLSASLRWPIRSYYQIIATTNPDADTHFLWRKFKDGQLTRIRALHEDNPSVTADYLDTLSRLTGVRRKRHYEGIWTSAHGQVLDSWDSDLNVVDERDPIAWTFGSMDWGHSAAGCLDVWGITTANDMVLLSETYHTKRTGGWWCDRLAQLDETWQMRAVVCDPSRPDMIADFNTRLGYLPDSMDAIAYGANNRKSGDLSGVNLLCEMVTSRRLKVMREYLVEVDPELLSAGLPTCSLEEISGYTWRPSADGVYRKDETQGTDHGMDSWRYACMFARGKDLTPPVRIPKDDPESYGALYNHNALVAALREAEVSGESFEDVYAMFLEEQNA